MVWRGVVLFATVLHGVDQDVFCDLMVYDEVCLFWGSVFYGGQEWFNAVWCSFVCAAVCVVLCILQWCSIAGYHIASTGVGCSANM